jgi:hypothetical protein
VNIPSSATPVAAAQRVCERIGGLEVDEDAELLLKH